MCPSENFETAQARESARQDWANSVATRKRLSAKQAGMTREATTAIVRIGHVSPGMNVLDVATGLGDPAITLAQLVGPTGHVTAVDMLNEMLEGAEEEAKGQGVTNISFQKADAESLPFPDQSFDLVTCKHAVMLFTDVHRALREIRRVLKSGGRAAFTAQGLPEQGLFQSCIMRVFDKYMQTPPPNPGIPHAHRFAQPGTLSTALREAGFGQVSEESPVVPWVWLGPPEEYWDSRRNQGVLFPRLIERLPPEQRENIEEEVIESIKEYYDGEQLNFTANIVVATAVR